jgi:anti-sigma-K factor RskA
MMDRNTLLDLIPAYALGALDVDERAEVEAFLATDTEAQAILADYQALTEAMVMATPAHRAPSHLGDDLRQRLAASRPSTNVVPPASSAPTPPDNIQVLPKTRRPPIWIPWAVAAAIIIVLAGVLVLRGRFNVDPQDLYTQIAAQPDALHIPITPVLQPSTSGDMVVSADGKQAVVRVENLPEISTDQTFQLWLVDPDGAHSGGLFKFPTSQGPNYIALPLDKPIADYKGFGVSIEPEGGSRDPNGPSGPRAFGVSTAS